MESASISANASLSKFFQTRFEYDRVTVLAIYWQDSPHGSPTASYKQEAEKVGELFHTLFKYQVEYFEIPSIDSEAAFDSRLNILLATNNTENSLLILHYGGHGDPDEANDRQSVWAL